MYILVIKSFEMVFDDKKDYIILYLEMYCVFILND